MSMRSQPKVVGGERNEGGGVRSYIQYLEVISIKVYTDAVIGRRLSGAATPSC